MEGDERLTRRLALNTISIAILAYLKVAFYATLKYAKIAKLFEMRILATYLYCRRESINNSRERDCAIGKYFIQIDFEKCDYIRGSIYPLNVYIYISFKPPSPAAPPKII